MTEPIRLLLCADIHIGMENYGKIDSQTGLSSGVMDDCFLVRTRLNAVIRRLSPANCAGTGKRRLDG
jgi:hypothetical protein